MADGNTGSSDTSARQDPLVGRRLASYEVLARVARGGMGVVYRARHVYIDKIVALKVLDPELSKRDELIERFRTEAQSLARVEHENVVKVIDILEDKGVHFIVMDFAEGTNLRVLVKEKGPMGGDELLSVARQTAEALYAAHREGILHRDIKPENLILNSRGRCKLADFGLAGDLRLISEGHEGPLNFGTPAYSAPEVMRRMVPDKRSDIFSYGATLYFLATGEPPFGQTGAQAIMLRQKQGAELLDGRRPDLPPKFTQLVMDCIKYHPKDRPDSFNELLERLPRRMVTRSIPGTPTAPTDPTDTLQLDSGTHETPEVGRGLQPLLIGGAILAALSVGIVLFFWISSLLKTPPNPIGQTNTGGVKENTARSNRTTVNPPPTLSNKEPGDGGPTFHPEDEAYNAAELDGRSALGNADYKGAYDAWAGFLRAYPSSQYADDAKENQNEVVKRVSQLRAQEYEKAKEASDTALKEKRTAEALGALDRFPDELLVPLSDGDEVSVQQKLDTQRQVVIAVEATDLARLLERADDYRADWQTDQDNAETLSEFGRMRNAGNLLRERDLLEGFLPGRTAASQEKINKRLASLRKLLETVHQKAVATVDAWRGFHDEQLSAWAQLVLDEIGKQKPELEKRRFKQVLKALDQLETNLTAQRTKTAASAGQVLLAERIAKCEFVHGLLDQYRDHVKLADRVSVALETNLRLVRRANSQHEFLVHAEIDSDGNRSTRIDKYTGRVTSVGNSDFTVSDDGERVTIRYDMLTTTTVRRLLHEGQSFDEQLSLVAWLVALGRTDDADTEFSRLERMDRVPADVLEQGAAIQAGGTLAPSAKRKLNYLVARGGQTASTEFQAGTLEQRLLDAQQRLARGDSTGAADYLEAVREVVDPELVNLEVFENALKLGSPTVGDLRNWTVLEPLNPNAWAALAEKLSNAGESTEARQAAGKALVLDGSNDAAWKIWTK
ncbi:MAG: protein kinase [Planctomycetes bacterium]|nr:protein kinase [Planctomycetota bacterium]